MNIYKNQFDRGQCVICGSFSDATTNCQFEVSQWSFKIYFWYQRKEHDTSKLGVWNRLLFYLSYQQDVSQVTFQASEHEIRHLSPILPLYCHWFLGLRSNGASTFLFLPCWVGIKHHLLFLQQIIFTLQTQRLGKSKTLQVNYKCTHL